MDLGSNQQSKFPLHLTKTHKQRKLENTGMHLDSKSINFQII